MEQEKKYLKTMKEVSDALAAGKVVYFDDDRQDTLKKDENGFILLENKYEKKLCVGCFLGIEDKPYILEQKPLEVKLWHLYEDKRGSKVLISGKYTDDVPYLFYGIVENVSSFVFYNKNGKYWETNNPYCDLVKELADLSKYFKKGE